MLTVLPYDGTAPQIAGPVQAGPGAAVLGRATLGQGAVLAARAVIRADGHYIRIGRNFQLGAMGTVHIAHGILPTHIGDDVSAGPGAVIHACDVADGCVIGAGAVILDGSVLEAGVVLAPGSTVFPRSTLQAGWLYDGCPAEPVRALTEDEREKARAALDLSLDGPEAVQTPVGGTPLFVASSAQIMGKVHMAENSSVFFGCTLDAGSHSIRVGAGTNIQDNTIVKCTTAPCLIGADVTLGHNVTMDSATVEDGALIGIGAVLAPGTHVEAGVLVAAGTRTEPGQRLSAGQLYTGRPAVAKRPTTDAQRAMMAATLPSYRTYAAQFSQLQSKD